ncbi:CHAC2 [Bugula neritina]|uniref:glutathione-specific gamma-glutamylcyclotransferase n=1 Tax=Bugula neritina TaxID=10212 RepID=A0A7J7JLV2_BUGNE|nr:CHAC2 [Bugula neritina]
MHVFGYGSLMWSQGFRYEEKVCGYVKGFKRRFWQGSEDHRGEPGKPGRVLSVFKSGDPNDIVLGVAFKIPEEDEELVRQNLIVRETGYDVIETLFYPIGSSDTHSAQPIVLELFLANQNTSTYLGPASERDIAWQIYHSKGLRGSNLDYFLRVVSSCKNLFPNNSDRHLEQIEQEVRQIAAEKGDTLDHLIGQMQ